jgi:hypothetical protein
MLALLSPSGLNLTFPQRYGRFITTKILEVYPHFRDVVSAK